MRVPAPFLIALMLMASVADAQTQSSTLVLVEGKSTISLTITPGESSVSNEEIRSWAANSARVVAGYFGRFPVARVSVTVVRGGPGRVGSGVTYGGRWIRIHLGEDAGERDLTRDWVMIHEMFHTAFPEMDDAHHWMEEGLSTYLEPVARARAGQLTPQQVWHEFLTGLPQGMPSEGDDGMDNSPSWGSTYWGGCRFWLRADLEIRQATGGKKTLADALRAILAAGGNGSVHWDAEKVLAVGDKATGTQVLQRLHQQMGEHAGFETLEPWWKQLGVEQLGGDIRLHDDAPLASLRRSLLER